MNNLLLSTMRPLMALAMLLTVLSGCKKNDDTIATPKTITDQVLEDKQFSLLRSAVLYAGVGDALKGANLTLFAPNDAAFQASGLATEAAITALPKEQVRNLLLYHVLYSPVSSTLVPSGLNSIQMANQGVAFINKQSGGTIFVNNAKVTQADMVVANGIIHIIDRVLTPSVGNLLTTIQNNPNLTYFSAALKRIATTNPTLLATINNSTSANPVTIFAPSDAAFKNDSRYATIAAIEATNAQALATALSYHVVSGVLLTNQLSTGTLNTLYTNNRVTITVLTPTQITVRGAKNTLGANIKTPDLVATNGVVHIIDQVLLP